MSTPTTTDPQSTAHVADTHDVIRVQGARVHNLKDISVEIPKRRLTVFSGVSLPAPPSPASTSRPTSARVFLVHAVDRTAAAATPSHRVGRLNLTRTLVQVLRSSHERHVLSR